jgi:hypothetical protein
MRPFILLFFIACVCFYSVSALSQSGVQIFIADFNNDSLRVVMEQHASSFLSDVNTAFIAEDSSLSTASYFSPSIGVEFALLWKNTPFYIPESIIIESVNVRTNGNYEIRNIPAYFVDKQGKKYYEDAVIQFTSKGLINEFRIGLSAHRYQELIDDGDGSIDNARRKTILQFLENFRTSYNRKDIEYITTVFSDQALIIVGRVIENTGSESAYQQQVEYLQFTKGEYVERLKQIFFKNEWIDVGYNDIDIIKHPKYPEIYGVSLTQYYSSETYSDEGFLFLLIDFEDPKKPLIHVRTWQPKKVTPEDEVFHIGYMEIFK